MLTTLPKNKYKEFKLEDTNVVPSSDLTVTGYKSMTPLYERHPNEKTLIRKNGQTDPEGAHIIFRHGEFCLSVKGVSNLTKIKEAIEFALEIKQNGSNDKGNE